MRERRVDVLRYRHEPRTLQILGVINSCNVSEIENITVIESVDVSCHHSVGSWQMCGYGLPVDDTRIPGMLEVGTRYSPTACT